MGDADRSEPIETASLDELRALQLRRMRDVLRHAYERIGHYRQNFAAAGVHPSTCGSWRT